MKKKSLYTAIGRLDRRTDGHGHSYPIILLGGNEYMADKLDFCGAFGRPWRSMPLYR